MSFRVKKTFYELCGCRDGNLKFKKLIKKFFLKKIKLNLGFEPMKFEFSLKILS